MPQSEAEHHHHEPTALEQQVQAAISATKYNVADPYGQARAAIAAMQLPYVPAKLIATIAAYLQSLHAWMLSNDLDMQMPDGILDTDPAELANQLAKLGSVPRPDIEALFEGTSPAPWRRDETLIYALDDTGQYHRFHARINGGYTTRSHGLDKGKATTNAELRDNARLMVEAPRLARDLIAMHQRDALQCGAINSLMAQCSHQRDEIERQSAEIAALKAANERLLAKITEIAKPECTSEAAFQLARAAQAEAAQRQ